jgi:hypothetical protein
MIDDDKFRGWIRDFMKMYDYKETEFGRLSVGDPNFVKELFVMGRSPKLVTVARVLDFMAGGPAKHAPQNRRREPEPPAGGRGAPKT